MLCVKKWPNEWCLGPNSQFERNTVSVLLNAQQEWETTQTACERLRAEPKINKKKAVRLTKISLNAFNGAKRALSLWCKPVKAPFGFVVRVSLRVQRATNGVACEQRPSEGSEHRDHTGLCQHTRSSRGWRTSLCHAGRHRSTLLTVECWNGEGVTCESVGVACVCVCAVPQQGITAGTLRAPRSCGIGEWSLCKHTCAPAHIPTHTLLHIPVKLNLKSCTSKLACLENTVTTT